MAAKHIFLLAMALWTSSCVLLPAAMADHTLQPAASSPAQPSQAAATGPMTTTAGTLPASSSSSSTAAAAAALPPATATPAAAASETTTGAGAGAATAPNKKFPLPTTPGGVEPDLPTPHGGPVEPDLPTPHGGPVEPDLPTPHGGPVEPDLPTPHGGPVVEPYLPAAEVAGALPVPTPDELPSAASLGFGSHGFGGPGDECCGGGGYGWFGGPGGFGPGTYGYSGPLYWGAAPPAAGLRRVVNVVLPLVVAYVSAAIFA